MAFNYTNNNGPFLDFLAARGMQGNNHPFFGQPQNYRDIFGNNLANADEREDHENPQAHPQNSWDWGSHFFGGAQGMPHRGPPPPPGPHGPAPQADEQDTSRERDGEKDGEKSDNDDDNGEGPSGSGADGKGRRYCGRGRHGCGGSGGRRSRMFQGPPNFRPDHHRPRGPHGPGGPHGHGPRGHPYGRPGWGGPWGGPWGSNGGFCGPHMRYGRGADLDSFLTSLFDAYVAEHPSYKNNKDAMAARDNEDFTPEADIFDTPSSYIVHISLPGAKKEDVGVNWDAGRAELSVAGVIYRPGDEEFLKTLATDERRVGPFERKIRLGTSANPAHVDAEGITAKLEDGVLRVEVRKEEEGFVEIKKVDIE